MLSKWVGKIEEEEEGSKSLIIYLTSYGILEEMRVLYLVYGFMGSVCVIILYRELKDCWIFGSKWSVFRTIVENYGSDEHIAAWHILMSWWSMEQLLKILVAKSCKTSHSNPGFESQ